MKSSIQEILKTCRHNRSAVLATNFYNYETLWAILQAASQTQSAVILQLTKSSIDYMGLEMAVKIGRQGLADYGLQGWLHLDHADSIALIKRCLDAGFDSVMIDASEKDFDENVTLTSTVVAMAQPYGANVEAELGYVAKLGQPQQGGLTTPEEARKFATLTKVDALAVAIGSAHGFYKEIPQLAIDRLAEIREATEVPLVLHGSSGIPYAQVREAIRHGICKVNLATEIKDNFMQTLKQILPDSQEIDLRKVFPAAIVPVVEMLKQKYEMVNLR